MIGVFKAKKRKNDLLKAIKNYTSKYDVKIYQPLEDDTTGCKFLFDGLGATYIVKIELKNNDVDIVVLSDMFDTCPEANKRQLEEYINKINFFSYYNEITMNMPDSNCACLYSHKCIAIDEFSETQILQTICSSEIKFLIFKEAIKKIIDGTLLEPDDYPETLSIYEKHLTNKYINAFFTRKEG